MAYHYTKPNKITEKLQVFFRDQYKHHYPPSLRNMDHCEIDTHRGMIRYDGIIRIMSKLFNVQVRRDKCNAALPYYVIGMSGLNAAFVNYLKMIIMVVEDNSQFYMERYRNKKAGEWHGHFLRSLYKDSVIQRFEAELRIMIAYKATLKFAAVRKVEANEILAQNRFNEYAKNYSVLKNKTPFKFYNP